MNLGKEDEYNEFKESMSQLDKGLKSVTAMLNRHGEATVYFGVADNGDDVGHGQERGKTADDFASDRAPSLGNLEELVHLALSLQVVRI